MTEEFVEEETELKIGDIKKEILSIIDEATKKAEKIKDEGKLQTLNELKKKISETDSREKLMEYLKEVKETVKVIETEERLFNKINSIIERIEPIMPKLSPELLVELNNVLSAFEDIMQKIKGATLDKLGEFEQKIKELEEKVSELIKKTEEKEKAPPPELSEFISIMEGEPIPKEKISLGIENEIIKALEETGVPKKSIISGVRTEGEVPVPPLPESPALREMILIIENAIRRAFRSFLEEFEKTIRVEIRSLMRRFDQRFLELQELLKSLQLSREIPEKGEKVVEKAEVMKVPSKEISQLLMTIDQLVNQVIPEDVYSLVEYAIKVEASKIQLDELIKKIGSGEIKVEQEVLEKIEEKRAKLYERVGKVREVVKRVLIRR